MVRRAVRAYVVVFHIPCLHVRGVETLLLGHVFTILSDPTVAPLVVVLVDRRKVIEEARAEIFEIVGQGRFVKALAVDERKSREDGSGVAEKSHVHG